MTVKVRIPTPLQKLTGGNAEVSAEAVNIRTLIEELEKNYPGIKERLCDETRYEELGALIMCTTAITTAAYRRG